MRPAYEAPPDATTRKAMSFHAHMSRQNSSLGVNPSFGPPPTELLEPADTAELNAALN